MDKLEEFLLIKEKSGLTMSDMAVILNVRERSVDRWLAGEKEIPDSVMEEARMIEQDVYWVLDFIKQNPVWAGMPYRFLKAAQYLLDKETSTS